MFQTRTSPISSFKVALSDLLSSTVEQSPCCQRKDPCVGSDGVHFETRPREGIRVCSTFSLIIVASSYSNVLAFVFASISSFFRKFGKVVDIWLASYHPFYAFITYKRDEDAEEAIRKMNDS